MMSFFEWYAKESESPVNWAKAELEDMLLKAGYFIPDFYTLQKILMDYNIYLIQQTNQNKEKIET